MTKTVQPQENRRRVWFGILAAIVPLAVCATSITVWLRAAAPDAVWRMAAGHQQGFTPVDPNAIQQIWPTIGTSVGVGAAVTTALGHATTALGLSATSEPVTLVAALAVLILFIIGRGLGWSVMAAAAAALFMAFGGVFWSLAVSARPATYAAVFVLASIGTQLWWAESRRRDVLALLLISYTLAIAVEPSALFALPFLVVTSWMTAASRREGAAVAGALVIAAAVGAAVLWAPVRGLAPISAWFVPDASQLADRFGQLKSGVVADLGALGLAFFAVGAAVLARRRPGMLVLCAGWTIAAGAWALIIAPHDGPGARISVLVPMWLVIGAGMNWTLGASPPTRPWLAILVALLPVVNAIGHAPAGAQARAATTFVAEYLDRLQTIVPPAAVLVAESRAIDGQIAARALAGGAPDWRRVPQDPAAIRRALTEGVPVVAFAGARANLEELGFRFAPIAAAGVPLTIEQYLRAVPKSWIIAAATGDRFGLGVLPRRGPTFGAVGGRIDLFDHPRSHYGIVGVSSGQDIVAEAADAGPVRLDLSAGDRVARAARLPASLLVTSDDRGGIISYKGAPVASTQTGLAMALLSPDGVLRHAVSLEFSSDMRVLMNPPSLMPAYIAGSEPCADTSAAGWTDVSAPAQLASLGGVLDGATHLVIYARSGHPLDPRQRPLAHHQVAEVRVQAFRSTDATASASLRAAIAADGLAYAPRWLAAAYVYRIDVESSWNGRRQLALDLGGFADAAVARVASGPGRTVTLCAAMRENTPTISAAMSPAAGEIDLANRDLFVYGWDRVEGQGRDRFRWTRALDAELLVPVARAAPMVLELDCVPTGAPNIELRVRINGEWLPPAALVPGTQTYRWTVPVAALRDGLNRVSIGTSALVRPMDIGPGTDDRRLGVAVHRIALGPAVTAAPGGGQ